MVGHGGGNVGSSKRRRPLAFDDEADDGQASSGENDGDEDASAITMVPHTIEAYISAIKDL